MKSLTEAVDLGFGHLSIYMLQLEPGTPFHRQGIPLPANDQVAETYIQAAQMLRENGFVHYEISNFYRKG